MKMPRKKQKWTNREYNLASLRWRRRKKLRAIEYLGGKCERCGFIGCPDAMDFHHKDPRQKDHTVSVLIARKSWEVVQPELDKCQLLCANCHRTLHWELNGGVVDVAQRGTPWRTDEERQPKPCEGCKKLFTPRNRSHLFCSRKCAAQSCANMKRKVEERPSRKEIQRLVEESGWSATGRKYGVSPTTIRRWFRASA